MGNIGLSTVTGTQAWNEVIGLVCSGGVML